MSRNGSGSYTLPAGNPVVTGTTISSTTHNNTLNDIATALTQSISADGQTPVTANLPMNNFKHTGVATAVALTQYPAVSQVQNGAFNYLTGTAGTDTITANASIAPSAYAAGQKFSFIAAGNNTGAATLNVSGLGAVAIKNKDGSALPASYIISGQITEVEHDGTNFILLSAPFAQTTGFTLTGALNESPPVTLASAATVNIGAAASNNITITGTTTITAFDTIASGAVRRVTFSGALTLSHNGTSLILPEGISIPTAAGDTAEFLSLGSGNWRCTVYTTAKRIPLSANITIYVATTGNDSNDGLAVGTPKLTIQSAYDLLANKYDLRGFTATIQIADGTYGAGLNATTPLIGSSGSDGVIITGNTGTPANVLLSMAGACINGTGGGVGFKLQGMKFISTANIAIVCARAARIRYGNVVFGACSIANLYCANGAIEAFSSYSIIGATGQHWYATKGGFIEPAAGITITITGTPAITFFAYATDAGIISCSGLTFSGGATGTRYSALTNGVIDTSAGGATYLPGSIAGSTATGGQYA